MLAADNNCTAVEHTCCSPFADTVGSFRTWQTS